MIPSRAPAVSAARRVSAALLGGRLPAPRVLLAPALAALLSAAPSSAHAQEGFHVTRLAPGVWSAEVVARPPFYAFANALVVELDGGVLVVDTQQSPSAARDLIGAIRRLTDAPVRWVVNTHGHADHVYGNAAYREAFPGVRFLAHEATARYVATETASALAEEIEALPGIVAQREDWLARDVGPSGEPLDAAARERVRHSLDVNRRQLDDLRGLELVVPEGFADSVVVGEGRRRAHVVHVGPAHTAGDVLVWLPGERIVAVGDLLEEGLPWVEGSRPSGWARALTRIEALDPLVVVPSHGAVQRDERLLSAQAGYFRALADGVAALAEEGVAWDAMPGRLDLDGFRRRMAGSGAGAVERWRTFVAAGVAAAREEREGGGP